MELDNVLVISWYHWINYVLKFLVCMNYCRKRLLLLLLLHMNPQWPGTMFMRDWKPGDLLVLVTFLLV